MISRETICQELEKQLLSNGMNCDKVILNCSATPCSTCFFSKGFTDKTVLKRNCWKARKELVKTVKRKLLLKKLLEK